MAGACLRQLPTMRLSLTVSRLESREPGRVRTGRAREAGDGAAEPRQQHAARMETGVKFARAALARTMLFHNTRRQASHASIHATQLQHTASATKPTKQSQQQSHQSITPSQHATATHLPTRASPGARNDVVLPADDTRAVPQRRTIGLLRQTGSRRGWRRCALGGRKQRRLVTGAVLAMSAASEVPSARGCSRPQAWGRQRRVSLCESRRT